MIFVAARRRRSIARRSRPAKTTSHTSYGLLLAGGLITIIAGIVMILIGAAMGMMMSFVPGMFFAGGMVGALIAAFGIWGLICGIFLLLSAKMVLSNDKQVVHTWGVIGLVFSILSLVTLQGIVVGPILALVGSILVLSES